MTKLAGIAIFQYTFPIYFKSGANLSLPFPSFSFEISQV